MSVAGLRPLLAAALAFLHLDWRDKPPVIAHVESYMNSWRGIGDIVVGMNAQGHDVELRQYPDGWRANFYWTGRAHSIVMGSAWQPTPWGAVQRAAWEALNKEGPA
jgi:hypothetical protein